jgi:predicted DNA-binding transcriptional regulator YafY
MQRLPHRVKMDVDDVKCLVKFDPGAVIKVERQKFFDINKACEMSRAVDITYHSADKDEVTTRMIDPYKLLQNRGTWYAVAWCRLRNDMRLFALHRIESYQVLDDVGFRVRDDFDVDAWIDKAFLLEHTGQEHRVKVHFKPRSARYIRERNWHASQELTEHEDKSCTLEFLTQSLEETKRWVLSYGSEAHVLEPPELRDMLREEHRRATQQYERDAG